jgi:non-heme chloroperoxidase
MAMATFDYDGHRIYYTDTHSAVDSTLPAIVFIHGWASSSKIYKHQIEYFRSTYRCIALDLLGHGLSDSPPVQSVSADFYSLKGLAKSIIALLSHLSIEGATFVGWSLGSGLALTIALNYPLHVENLVLVSAVPVLFLPTDDDDFPAMPHSQVGPFLDSIKNNFNTVSKEFIFQCYPEATPESHPDYVDEALRYAAPMSPEVAHLIISLSGSTDFRDVIHNISARTLIINGSEDMLCPAAAGEWMSEKLGGESVFIQYNGCGHVAFVGPAAERFNLHMDAFLANR